MTRCAASYVARLTLTVSLTLTLNSSPHPGPKVRGFVCGGWADVANREGDLSDVSPLLKLSLSDFESEVLPTLGPSDAVILLGGGSEPPPPPAVPSDAEDDFDGEA